MLERDVFIEIIESAKIIDKVMTGIEDAFDIQMGDGHLLDAQSKLLNLLVDICEEPLDGEESYIYKFAFNNGWGNKPDYQIMNDTRYHIDDFGTLYNYLADRYKFKKQIVEDEV